MTEIHREDRIELTVKNIGGIEQRSEIFDPGTTLLTGRNATNRSSLLRAVATAFGSTHASIRRGAERGEVELTVGDETASRELSRAEDGTVVFAGDPYLEGPESARSAELFAFLFWDNPVRRAIRGDSDDLRDLLMHPIDADEIERRLYDLRRQIASLEDEREEYSERVARLPDLEDRRDELRQRREELDERISELETRLADIDEAAPIEDRQSEYVTVRRELDEAHDAVATAKEQRAREQSRVESLQERRDSLEAELDALEVPDEDERELRERRATLIAELNDIESEIDHLEKLISTHREHLSSRVDAERVTGDEPHETPVAFLESETSEDTTTCWACGERVPVEQLKDSLGRLRAEKRDLEERQGELEAERADIDDKLSEIHDARSREDELWAELEDLQRTIQQTKHAISELNEKITEREERAEELREELEDLSLDDHHQQLLDAHDEVADAREERARVEERLDSVESDIEDATDAAGERDAIDDELAELRRRRDELNDRIRRREETVLETFNDQIGTILDLLEFENIERIWLERVTGEPDGQSQFRVNVARECKDGVVRSDRIPNLSESEGEVTGIVLALAGYLAHGVYEKVPVVLMDEIEAIDAERAARLIDHISDYADIVVAAVLKSDTQTGLLRDVADDVITFNQPETAGETTVRQE